MNANFFFDKCYVSCDLKCVAPCVLQACEICACVFSLYMSVSAGCASMAQQFMNPHLAPDSLFWQFFVVALYSLPLFVPALAFLPHSFCPIVDEDTVEGCLSSL